MRREGAARSHDCRSLRWCAPLQGAFEHGDGLCRAEWIEWRVYLHHRALAQIKHHMDNLLCPQRIINPPRWTTPRVMRLRAQYKVIPSKPRWTGKPGTKRPGDRADQRSTGGDPAQGCKAVEMCNNGHCRKFDAGTMCPSDVTRGTIRRGSANTCAWRCQGRN
jgi:hypothetical protein